jgi:hypothetical protein
MPATDKQIRAIWLAVTLLAGAIIGTAAGLLSWAGGTNPFNAVLTGAGAFAGTVIFIVTLIKFATGESN